MRLTAAEHAEIVAAARAAGSSVGQVVRDVFAQRDAALAIHKPVRHQVNGGQIIEPDGTISSPEPVFRTCCAFCHGVPAAGVYPCATARALGVEA